MKEIDLKKNYSELTESASFEEIERIENCTGQFADDVLTATVFKLGKKMFYAWLPLDEYFYILDKEETKKASQKPKEFLKKIIMDEILTYTGTEFHRYIELIRWGIIPEPEEDSNFINNEEYFILQNSIFHGYDKWSFICKDKERPNCYSTCDNDIDSPESFNFKEAENIKEKFETEDYYLGNNKAQRPLYFIISRTDIEEA